MKRRLDSYCVDGMRWFGPEGSNDPREWDSTECKGCESCEPESTPDPFPAPESAEDYAASLIFVREQKSDRVVVATGRVTQHPGGAE